MLAKDMTLKSQRDDSMRGLSPRVLMEAEALNQGSRWPLETGTGKGKE
jgi:hypothetical protein